MCDYVCSRSVHLCAPGNTFYLVMPSEQGETTTDDLNDPPTPTASHFPPLLEEATSRKIQSVEDTSTCGQDQSENMQQEQEEEVSQSKATDQSHVIKNVDEIFHMIEKLTSKLRQLKVNYDFIEFIFLDFIE